MGLLDSIGSVFSNIPIIGDIIGAGVNHYENVRNQHFQSDEAKAQREWTSNENQMARQWQEDMYNQYNSPSAMMQQYKKANLNPFLMANQQQLGQGMSSNAAMAGSGAHASGSLPASAPDVGDHMLRAMGVSAQAANQNAQTLRIKWSIYESILEHGDRATAKAFLHANPDMLSDADPENSPWFKSWSIKNKTEQLKFDQESFEYTLRQFYGPKTAEIELYRLRSLADDLQSQISKRNVEINEINATIRKINEQIKTEKSIQARNYSESDLASSKAKTENESRQYVVRQLLLNTGILSRFDQTDLAHFESMESLRGWITSNEGKKAFAEAARNAGLRNADALYTAVMSLLGSVSLGAHANLTPGGNTTSSLLY